MNNHSYDRWEANLMGNDRTFKLTLSGLDCANCANKIEDRVNRLELVE